MSTSSSSTTMPEIISCGKVITLHSFESRQPLALYNPHRGLINGLSVNHTNKVIASCGQDGKIVLVSADQPEKVHFEQSFNSEREKSSSVNCCAFSSNSKFIAAGSADSVVKVWDLKQKQSKKAPYQIKSHIGAVTSLAWIKSYRQNSSLGEILVSSSSIGDISLNSIKANSVVETLSSKSQEGINAIRVSESEDHLRLAACTNAGSVLIWDLNATQKDSSLICSFNNSTKASITSLSFSSFNPVLLVTCSVDENLIFYDIHEKKAVKTIATQESLTAVNFHSNGHTLIAGGRYGGLFVYDLRKPHKYKEKLVGHETTIKYLQFFKDRESSNEVVNNSRASKTVSQHSVNSQLSSTGSNNFSNTLPSQISEAKSMSLQQDLKAAQIIQNSRQVLKPQQMKNNYIVPSTPGNHKAPPVPVEPGKVKLVQSKLTTTGQEVIRNAQLQRVSEKQLSSTLNSVLQPSSNSQYMKHKAREAALQQQKMSATSTFPSQSNSNTQPKGPFSSTTSYSPPPIQIQHETISLSEVKTIKQSITTLERRIRGEMSEMGERINLEMIRQFQISQQETRRTIEELLFRDRKKDQYIKQLQNQVKKLKEQTF